jgi:outer membrane protein assembly factor BamB
MNVVLALLLQAAAQDWPHWRGPERNDVVSQPSGWGTPAWPLGEPAWTRNVGQGSTSPLIAGGRLYVMGWEKDRDSVSALDLASGKPLWSAAYPCPQHGRNHMGDEQFYGGPTATPEFDPASGRLITLSTDGDLNCWDGKTGKRTWGLNLYALYKAERRPHVGAEQRDYGYITAPLVIGDQVLVQVGAADGCVMAFAKESGKRVWVSECRDAAGHSGGLSPITVEGVPCVAMMTLTNLVVFRVDKGKEGKTIATFPWTTDFGNNVASPAVFEDSVLVTSEYNHKSICRVKVTLQGATKVWEQPYASKACTPVIFQGHVYWAWRKMHCLEFATGQQKWEGGDFADAGSCIATGDGRLLVWGGLGRLSLVENAVTSPDAYKEVSRAMRLFTATPWPHVVLAAGRLVVKDRDGNLKCFVVGPAK